VNSHSIVRLDALCSFENVVGTSIVDAPFRNNKPLRLPNGDICFQIILPISEFNGCREIHVTSLDVDDNYLGQKLHFFVSMSRIAPFPADSSPDTYGHTSLSRVICFHVELFSH
jgi:hypothetical protein